jgi:hypothetical protein
MGTDGEKFHHGGVAQAQPFSRVEVGLGHDDFLSHAAIAVHADNRQGLAAIGLALGTGGTLVAGQIGIDDHRIASRQRGGAIGVEHHPAQFMPHDARILQERVLALVDVIVGAADADMADAHPHPTGLQRGPLDIHQSQLARRRT